MAQQAATGPAPAAWTAQEIELAQARCTALLKDLDVVVVAEVPIREGAECGTAAPLKLISIGKSPQVAFMPPPILTCDMIAALHKWVQRDIQPLARKHLGAPVVRIDAMSSYSCRNAYGSLRTRLSEHGRANALDISTFLTARAGAAMVVADWGPTARELEAQVIAAAAAEKAPAEPPAAAASQPPQVAAPAPQSVAAPAAAPRSLPSRPGLSIRVPGVTLPSATPPSDRSTGLGLVEPNRLGGPKPADKPATSAPAAAVAPPPVSGKAAFLRAVHRASCKIFATTLGPEANTWHKNHFHVDMAERAQNRTICE